VSNSVPQTRTDVSKRTKDQQSELLRWFLGPDGTPWPDWNGRARVPGRSVYTGRTMSSVREAVEQRTFGRGFKTNVAADADLLVERVCAAGTRIWFDRLGLANRAGVLSVGEAASREGTKMSGWFLILADDASQSTVKKFRTQALRKDAKVVCTSGYALGRALGREYVSVITVAGSRFRRDLQGWASALGSYPDSGFETPSVESGNVAGSKSRANSVSARGLSEKECQSGSTK
jgi:predicted RNA-binding protein YlxR (DUF448 family)